MTDETPAERSTRHMAERAALVADSAPAQHDNLAAKPANDAKWQSYRGWSLSYDYPPIPYRGADWSACSPDYDVDCDQDGFFVCGGTQLHAATYEAICAEIDQHIADEEFIAEQSA